MKKYNAFTLFELIIYMVIFSVFSMLSFGYLSKFYCKVFNQMKRDKFFIRNNIIIDTLRRDIFTAKTSLIYWDEKNFIFRTKNISGKIMDISWQFRNNGIFRVIGQYDFNKKNWLKKNSAKLDSGKASFRVLLFKDLSNQNIESIKITLNEEVFFVELKNKMFVL